MPLRFDIKPSLNLLHVAASGRTTGRQFLQCARAYTAHPDFHPEIDVLYDVPGNVEIELRDDGILAEIECVFQAAWAGTPHRAACITRTSEHETFFYAAADLISPGAELETFDNFPDALAWLGLPDAGIRIRRRGRRAGARPGQRWAAAGSPP